MNKKLITAASIALAACVAIGGTIAYLTDKTDTITNTFTVGDVNVALTEVGLEEGETEQSFKVTPGAPVKKEADVSVKAESENAYIFVEAVATDMGEPNNLTYQMAEGWTQIAGTNVYYWKDIIGSEGIENIQVLKNDQVQVPTDLKELTGNPTLTFKAYAVQADTFDSAEAAWAATFGATQA